MLRVLIVLCMLVVLRLVVRLIFGLCLFMCLLLGSVVYCIRLLLVYFVCLLLGCFGFGWLDCWFCICGDWFVIVLLWLCCIVGC